MMTARAQLTLLEASMQADDELMARVVAELREHTAIVEDIEMLERYRSVMRSASASFVVEAVGILRDQEKSLDAIFGAAQQHTWHQ